MMIGFFLHESLDVCSERGCCNCTYLLDALSSIDKKETTEQLVQTLLEHGSRELVGFCVVEDCFESQQHTSGFCRKHLHLLVTIHQNKPIDKFNLLQHKEFYISKRVWLKDKEEIGELIQSYQSEIQTNTITNLLTYPVPHKIDLKHSQTIIKYLTDKQKKRKGVGKIRKPTTTPTSKNTPASMKPRLFKKKTQVKRR